MGLGGAAAVCGAAGAATFGLGAQDMVPAALGTIRPVPHSQSHARRRALRDAEVPWLMTFIGRRPMRASAHKTERL
jgi:hypothetical protein